MLTYPEMAVGRMPRAADAVSRGRGKQGGEKTLSPDKFRQIPTRGRFAAEFGPAKKDSPGPLPGKYGKKPRKTPENGRFF
jgi:hypothetical protein